MVDLLNMQINDSGTIHQIIKIDVWWIVPGFGLYRKIDEIPADRRSVVYPQPVALAKSWYELIPPEIAIA